MALPEEERPSGDRGHGQHNVLERAEGPQDLHHMGRGLCPDG